MTRILSPSLAVITLFALAGCASHGPVLYPNTQLQRVGEVQAQKDVDDCERLASQYVKSNAGKETASSTALGAAGGALVGGAVGAVTGDFGRSVAVGAAGGGAGGLFSGLFHSSQPSPLYKNFVDHCLRQKGYEPIGWQ
ncbi:MAG TPA: hypothetical protein VFR01_03300 [Geobacterales bacterium]|nr:hypothetical protein [Geobacterales bacterium]